MIAAPILVEKIKSMAEEIGREELDDETDHYYERDIVDRLYAGDGISVTEAVEAVQYLRSILDRQEAS